jgi:mannose-1-phosphate guanylyltransferase
MKIVIRAGGIGTRLWPMSRTKNPKQFQNMVGDKTMIRSTYDRISPLLKSPNDIFVSVNRIFKKKIKKELPDLKSGNIIVETDTRNTGPAMCLEVCFLEKHCNKKEVVASLPADDFISDSESFCNLLLMSEKFILENPEYVLTPAIMPNYPDTGYTYFKAGKNLQKSGEEAVYSVADVVEKPNYEYCQSIIKTGVYYCHTGMYLWQLEKIVNLFKKWQPEMYKICKKIVNLMPDEKNYEKIQELYCQLEKTSVESAITDRIDKIAMSVSNKIGWSDLGKWHVVHRVLKNGNQNNVIKGRVITNESSNNLIYSNKSKKIIVTNDIKNLVIVDTEDALFISSLKKSADVKELVKKLEEEGLNKYL